MAQRDVPAGWDSPAAGWDSPADRPSVLEITVESGGHPRATVRRPHVLIAIVVLAAIGAAILVATLPGGGGDSTPPPAPAPHQPSVLVDSGPPSDTAPQLYRFPVGCLYSKPTAVERNRPGPCSPQDGYFSAVVRRVGGVWRVTLEPTDPSCSQMPMPPPARRKVKACRR